MDVEQALALVQREAARSSAAEVARAIGVHDSAVSRWRQGDVPTGKLRAKLLAWAEVQTVADQVPAAILEAARTQTAANRKRLAHIMGQAEAIATMLEGVLRSQRNVVESLRPWVTLEEEHDTDEAVEARALAVTRHVATHAPSAPTAAESPHPDTSAGAGRTARRPARGTPTRESSRTVTDT